MGDSEVEGSRGPAWAAGAGWGHPVCRPGWAAPASWRKRDQLCPAPRSFPAPLQWAFGNTVRSRADSEARSAQGLGGPARPLPGASAAWWTRGRRFRLPSQGERPPARAGLGEAEEPGRGRSRLSKAAAGGRSFLLVWFPAAKHLVPPGEGNAGFGARRGSARGRSGPFAASPPHPGTPTPPCFKPQAL